MATVIPYTNNATMTKSASPVLPRKPPLTLQESGIFEEEEEEEEHEEDEGEESVELTSRGTQTEVPSGELLQEVQRLQELRARIQERAAKIATPVFHPIDSSKICLDVSTMDSIVQLTSYQERVRDLEERLETHEEAEKNRVRERQLSKQREEELLDENYKLTERIYWLENEMRNVAECENDECKGETTVAQRNENIEQNKSEENLEAAQNICMNNVECYRHQDQTNGKNSDRQNTSEVQCNVTVCN